MDLATLLSSFASAFTQDQRLVTLQLGDGAHWGGTLLPHSATGSEALSQPYRYRVECLSPSVDLELKSLLGLPAQLGILTADGGELVRGGVITRAEALPADGGFARYALTIEPPLALLAHRRTSRVFQDRTVPDLVRAVLDEHLAGNPVFAAGFAVRFELRETYPLRSYCLQYRETDLAFVSRLLAEEGLAYRFDHAAGDTPKVTLVVFDDPYALPQAQQGSVRFHRADATETEDSLTGWTSARQLGTAQVALASFDYRPVATLQAQDGTGIDQGDGGAQAERTLADYDAQTLYYASDDDALARYARLRQQALDAHKKGFAGSGTLRSLRVGEWFQLRDHPHHDADAPEQREFVATRLTFRARNNLPGGLLAQLGESAGEAAPFQVDFDAQRRGIPLPPLYSHTEHARPTAPGVQTATVVGPAGQEVHTDPYGRIKVQLHWQRRPEHPDFGANQDERSSCWLRVAYPSAGAQWGHQFIPRIGQEVLVDFVEGDIDRPLVVGTLYNGSHLPPTFSGAGSLPANHTLSGIKSQEFGTTRYNELLFDDTQGELRLKLSSEHGKTQLNQGYLAHPRRDGKAEPRGDGFELRTDHAGALRAAHGLLLSTEAQPGAAGQQLDRAQAQAQLEAAQQLAQTLSDTAQHQLADPAEIGPDTVDVEGEKQAKTQHGHLDHLNEALKAWEAGSNTDEQGKTAKEQPGQQPILLASAPAGIALTTAHALVLNSGQNLDTLSQRDTQQSTARRWIHNVGSRISLFVQGVVDKVNLKLITAKGHAQLQAQSGDVEIVGDQNVRLHANQQQLTGVAKAEMLLNCGGAAIRMRDGRIDLHAPGQISIKASSYSFDGPDKLSPGHPAFPAQVLATPPAIHLDQAPLGVKSSWAGMPYQLYADGALKAEGVIDALGQVPVQDHSPLIQQYRVEMANGVVYDIPVAVDYRNAAQGDPANQGFHRHQTGDAPEGGRAGEQRTAREDFLALFQPPAKGE
ncbi:type VI secretion system tip protein VgrG [Chitiniphilus purpureus]|uniref:Type VI secretion system tip protein VgrG n=1 Tax=Chitiniphilus purpureus TaxID=2981137 RepID=A0ABY6DPN3_9NEIS|nr:type VI secretion system Vgr family protein [Chitiniphilus sp. CD1]UXY16344.1 type VI secretion system tip protein VgrG [Chitiniphilus sp. CD1]